MLMVPLIAHSWISSNSGEPLMDCRCFWRLSLTRPVAPTMTGINSILCRPQVVLKSFFQILVFIAFLPLCSVQSIVIWYWDFYDLCRFWFPVPENNIRLDCSAIHISPKGDRFVVEDDKVFMSSGPVRFMFPQVLCSYLWRCIFSNEYICRQHYVFWYNVHHPLEFGMLK